MTLFRRVQAIARSHLPGPLARPGLWAAIALLTVTASCTEIVTVDVPESPNGASVPTRTGTKDLPPGVPPVPVIVDDPGLPVQTRDGTLRGSPLSASRRATASPYRLKVAEQLGYYPPALLERVGLKAVVLCEGLAFDGTACSAYTDVERGRIYLNAQAGFDEGYLRWTVHHEVFHQLDYAGDHQLDPDPRWESLNPPWFRYSRDVERLQADPSEAQKDEGATGFLNRYAAASPAEDKAELYAALVVEPEGVRRRADRDDVLRRKVARVREMLDAFGPYSRLLTGR